MHVLTSPLTLVLAETTGTETIYYLHGLDMVAQHDGAATEYFAYDGLGSVRQMLDSGGGVLSAQAFDPYGNPYANVGTGSTSFGFTGEQTDESGLIFLRARYYWPQIGRFTIKDTWLGDFTKPPSLNRWTYVEGNPITRIDPSGQIILKEAPAANFAVDILRKYLHVKLIKDWGYVKPKMVPLFRNKPIVSCRWEEGEWSLLEIKHVLDEVVTLAQGMGGNTQFISNTGGIEISQDDTRNAAGLTSPHHIKFTNSPNSFSSWTVMHELAHAWDANFGWKLSRELEEFTGGYTNKLYAIVKRAIGNCDPESMLPGCNNAGYYYSSIPAKGSDINFDRKEDFAESVTAYFHKAEAQKGVNQYKNTIYEELLYYSDYTKTLRWKFVDNLLYGEIAP
jgi:RHS repeat-associated protein